MTKVLSSQDTQTISQADALIDSARTKARRNRLEDSIADFAEAAAKREKVLGLEDPAVAEIFDEIAVIYGQLGKWEDAHEFFDKSVKIYEKCFYDAHYKIAPVLSHQGSAYMSQGQFEKAEEVLTRAHGIFTKTLTGEHSQTLEATYKLAITLRQLGKKPEALKLFVRIKKALEAPLGPTGEFKFLEAMILEEDEKLEQADAAYKEAIRCFRAQRNMARLSSCLTEYAKFLDGQGRKDEALACNQEAEHLRDIQVGMSRNSDMFTTTLIKA